MKELHDTALLRRATVFYYFGTLAQFVKRVYILIVSYESNWQDEYKLYGVSWPTPIPKIDRRQEVNAWELTIKYVSWIINT